MEKITKEKLKQIANTLMLDMNEKEYEKLEQEFELIVKKMNIIGDLKEDIDLADPMTFPFELFGKTLREDKENDLVHLKTSDVLLNAKNHDFNQIKIKKVVK